MSANIATMSWSEPRTNSTNPAPWGWILVIGLLIVIAVAVIGLALATTTKQYDSAELGTISVEMTEVDSNNCIFKGTLSPKQGSALSAGGFIKLPCSNPLVQQAALSKLLDQFIKDIEQGKRSPDWWNTDGKIIRWIKQLWETALLH